MYNAIDSGEKKVRYPLLAAVMLALTLMLLPLGSAYAQERDVIKVTISDLLSADMALDGELVEFTGEAIGDLIDADPGYRWVLVSQDGSALSVRMSEADSDLIEHFGRYGMVGTKLRVIGEYLVANPDQAGELDVSATSVEVIEAGGPVEMPAERWKLYTGAGLFALAGILALIYRYLKRRAI